MSYLEGWESVSKRLDEKCGKGWQPGPGGKCVRSKMGRNSKKGLSALQVAGIAAGGYAGLNLAAAGALALADKQKEQANKQKEETRQRQNSARRKEETIRAATRGRSR